MDRTLGIFSAAALVLALVTAAMVAAPAASHGPMGGTDAALRVAKGFVTGEATYKFDGMADTLKLDVTGTFPDPGKYEVTCDFTSAHGGYGDRNGMIVTEALTPHQCVIIVSGDGVASALMDGSYDMVDQRSID